MSASRSLVVKVTVAAADPERCWQGFQVAAAGLALGAPVSLWLSGDAVRLGLPGGAEGLHLDHAAPLAELLQALLADGQVTVCTACAQRRGIAPADLLPGVRVAGSATFAEESLAPGAQALVY